MKDLRDPPLVLRLELEGMRQNIQMLLAQSSEGLQKMAEDALQKTLQPEVLEARIQELVRQEVGNALKSAVASYMSSYGAGGRKIHALARKCLDDMFNVSTEGDT